MALIHYRAVDAAGHLHQGSSQAQSVDSLERELAGVGLRLLRHRRWQWQGRGTLSQRPPKHDALVLATLSFHLSHLLGAGVPMADALDELVQLETRAAWRRLLADVREQVINGDSLSGALARYQPSVRERCLACIKAGEASGKLPACLARLEQSLRWQHDLSRRIANLMVYPTVAAVLLIAVVFWLFGYVVPRLIGFLLASGETPGVLTRSVAFASELAVQHGVAILLGVVMVALAIAGLLRVSTSARLCSHAMLLRFGTPGRLVQQLLLARYAETAALLLTSGVSLLESLAISEAQVSNQWLRRELARLRAHVLDGDSLAEAMARQGSLPSTLARLVAAGESAGALPQALSRAGEQLQLGARHTLDRVEALLPSAVLCIVGLLLLWVVAAVIVPIYDLIAISGNLG